MASAFSSSNASAARPSVRLRYKCRVLTSVSSHDVRKERNFRREETGAKTCKVLPFFRSTIKILQNSCRPCTCVSFAVHPHSATCVIALLRGN